MGDAGYCASPAAGMGGSLAIIGATELADALANADSDYPKAFELYDKNLRPFIDEIQAMALQTLDQLLPATDQQAMDMWQNGLHFLS